MGNCASIQAPRHKSIGRQPPPAGELESTDAVFTTITANTRSGDVLPASVPDGSVGENGQRSGGLLLSSLDGTMGDDAAHTSIRDDDGDGVEHDEDVMSSEFSEQSFTPICAAKSGFPSLASSSSSTTSTGRTPLLPPRQIASLTTYRSLEKKLAQRQRLADSSSRRKATGKCARILMEPKRRNGPSITSGCLLSPLHDLPKRRQASYSDDTTTATEFAPLPPLEPVCCITTTHNAMNNRTQQNTKLVSTSASRPI